MIQFAVLGPARVISDGREATLTPAQRAVLAALLLQAGRVVSIATLARVIWDDAPPPSARTTIQGHVKWLRQLLGAESARIVTRAPGYLIEVRPDELDEHKFTQLRLQASAAVQAGDWGRAADLLREALALWTGEPLADVPSRFLQRTEVPRLAELRQEAHEARVEADLRLGRNEAAIAELRALVSAHPFRERLWELLMLALYRAGRRADALSVYQQARDTLREGLGIDPGQRLQRLHAQVLSADPELDDEEPPARDGAPGTVRVTPRQLPADTSDFTGRTTEVADLRQSLSPRAGRRLTVVVSAVSGGGGVGKSTLALHTAHLLRDEFPDGQLYVSLGGTSNDPAAPGDMLARLLRDLGVPASDVPASDEERAVRYRTLLAGRRILLLLDDARDAAQVRPLLPGSESCAVLVTSRARLNDLVGAVHHDLEVMSLDEGRELFGRVVGVSRAAREPVATETVLRACGGLPLAIRIAAAKVAARPGWSIEAAASRLAAERDRLAELRVGDLAVRASFQLGFASIDPPARRAFLLLGVAGLPEIQLGAAAALLDVGVAGAEEVLDTLTDARMLQAPEPDSYRLHDLLRLFASELAASEVGESEREQAMGRLLGWYAGALRSAARVLATGRPMPPGTDHLAIPDGAAISSFSSHNAALAWCDREYVTLVWAVRTAAAHQRHDLAVAIAALLWMYASRTAESENYLISQLIGLDSARVLGDKPVQAWLLNGIGSALARGTHYAEAIENYEESLRIRSELGDRMGEVPCHNNIANVLFDQGRYAESVQRYKMAAAIAEATEGHCHQAALHVNTANAYREMGAYEDALDSYSRAMEVSRLIGDFHETASARTGMGETYRRLGRLAESVQQHQMALAIHRELGAGHRELLTALDLLAEAYGELGRITDARRCWLEAAAIGDNVDDPRAADFRERARVAASNVC